MPEGLARYRRFQQRMRHRAITWSIRRLRPDLVLLLNGEVFDRDTLAEMRRLTPGRLACWWVDDPFAYTLVPQTIDLYDHIFVFGRSYMPRLEAAGARRTSFLPCACDESVYHPWSLSRMEEQRFTSDVTFVGWYYPERAPVIRALAEDRDLTLNVWGGQWDTPEARRALDGASPVCRSAVDARTAAKIYSASRIGLNVHARQSLQGGLNMRTFELAASGLFQLVDRIPGLDELLTPGCEVACYDSPEEARRLARRYLDDPAARQAMATRARQRVLDEHTYVHRLRTLCELVRG